LIEHLYDRIGVALPREPTKYAIMKTAAWAYPVRDPWVDDVPWFFKGDVVQISKEGYQILDTDVEIAFFTGLCSGIFFYGEAVEVLPWPFLIQPGPHHYKYIAKGGGQKVAYGGGGGTAPPGSAAISNDDDRIGGGNDAFHFISTDGRGAPDGFLFRASTSRRRRIPAQSISTRRSNGTGQRPKESFIPSFSRRATDGRT
jgi:hypothetical protein